MKEEEQKSISRPPVVAVLGHIDHGKSTLLDHIRKTNIAEQEEGGITQSLSSYEVIHPHPDTKEPQKITFLDTPGHEAFSSIRMSGTNAADVAILVVSAEDGVKPQTTEALETIKKAGLSYVVALNKIDKPNADLNMTKQSLAENEIYIEEYGGEIPIVPVSAITGEGVNNLLDMIILVSDMEELKGSPETSAEGVIIESNIDPKEGTRATLIIKNGTLKLGQVIAAKEAFSPVRKINSFEGKSLKEATFSSPVNIAGWNTQPAIGESFTTFENKKEAEKYAEKFKTKQEIKNGMESETPEGTQLVPVIIKADTSGGMEAVLHEIDKLRNKYPNINIQILSAGVGSILESDIRNGSINENTVILGFNSDMDKVAKRIQERINVPVNSFSIIYELSKWLDEYIEKNQVWEIKDQLLGSLLVLKIFNSSKKSYVVGGKVKEGKISKNNTVKLVREEEELGYGRIKGLQQQKSETNSVNEGGECGLLVELPTEPKEGDTIQAVIKKT